MTFLFSKDHRNGQILQFINGVLGLRQSWKRQANARKRNIFRARIQKYRYKFPKTGTENFRDTPLHMLRLTAGSSWTVFSACFTLPLLLLWFRFFKSPLTAIAYWWTTFREKKFGPQCAFTGSGIAKTGNLLIIFGRKEELKMKSLCTCKNSTETRFKIFAFLYCCLNTSIGGFSK